MRAATPKTLILKFDQILNFVEKVTTTKIEIKLPKSKSLLLET
jgi:hypothetical protein